VWKVWNQDSALPPVWLGSALLFMIRPLLLRFYLTFQKLLFGFGKAWKKSRLLRVASLLAAVPLVFVLCGMIYLNYNRTDLPDLEAFIRFEPPSSGHICDANGQVLIELGRDRPEVMQYSSIPCGY